jgi:hypothetical protein
MERTRSAMKTKAAATRTKMAEAMVKKRIVLREID